MKNIEYDTSEQGMPRRQELLELLCELADLSAQQRLWVRHEDAPNVSGINEVFHFFFDDTDLGSKPETEVGILLKNQTEANVIRPLSKTLLSLLDRLGDADDESFLADPEWKLVTSLAANAHLVLSAEK